MCFISYAKGPWLWFPPPGSSLVVSTPKPVVLRDIGGEQQGANHWKALRQLMATLLEDMWAKACWAKHSCDLCRRWIVINGEWRSIKAAVIDGIVNTRGPCCAVHDCPHDLPNLGGARSVLMLRVCIPCATNSTAGTGIGRGDI